MAAIQPEKWAEIDESELTIAERCVYRTRRRAMELYLKGGTAREILCVTGLSRIAVTRLWERCCETDPDTGESRGFKALVPRSKMKRFVR